MITMIDWTKLDLIEGSTLKRYMRFVDQGVEPEVAASLTLSATLYEALSEVGSEDWPLHVDTPNAVPVTIASQGKGGRL